MKCPKCGFENPDTANYCIHCGNALRTKPLPQENDSKETKGAPGETAAPSSSKVSKELGKASLITGACILSAPVGVGLGIAALATSRNHEEKKRGLTGLILSSVISVGLIVGLSFGAHALGKWAVENIANGSYFTAYDYEDGVSYTVDKAAFSSAFDGAASPKVVVVENHFGRNYFDGIIHKTTIYDGNSASVSENKFFSSEIGSRYLSLKSNVLSSFVKKNGVWSVTTSNYPYTSVHAGVFELRYHAKDDLSAFYDKCVFDSSKHVYAYSETGRSDPSLDSEYSVFSLDYSFFFKNGKLCNIRYYYTYSSDALTLHISDESLFSSYDTASVNFPSDMPVE